MHFGAFRIGGLARILSFSILALCAVLVYNQISSDLFIFPNARPFGGDYLYNPYVTPVSSWAKANFHAHARSYGGLTNGKQPGDEVVRAYVSKGYRVAGLSDYFRVNPAIYAPENIPVPVFEHGLNPLKVHQLVIGASEPVFEDIVAIQNDHTRQSVLNRLARLNAFVCIAHPRNRDGHPMGSLDRLSGYQAIEIYNGPHPALKHWDAALSAGRPVWGMANDDIHDVHEARFASSWNMIPGDLSDSKEIVQALRAGQFFSVHRLTQASDSLDALPLPLYVDVIGDSVKIKFNRVVDTCRIVGQSGKIRFRFENSDYVIFPFEQRDTYLRAELVSAGYKVFTNPILRLPHRGHVVTESMATVDPTGTFQMRIGLVVLFGCSFLVFFSPHPLLFSFWIISRLRSVRNKVNPV